MQTNFLTSAKPLWSLVPCTEVKSVVRIGGEAKLKPLVDDEVADFNPKDAPLSQMFDFSLLQQILKDGR